MHTLEFHLEAWYCICFGSFGLFSSEDRLFFCNVVALGADVSPLAWKQCRKMSKRPCAIL